MDTTKRDGWTFAYSTAELLRASQERVAHHTERLEHWTTERDAREEKLRAEGIDIRAAVRAGVANSTAYYGQPTLDADLLHALQEAQERVDFHTERQEAFARWVRALQHDEDRTRELTVQDIEFFGL